MAESRKTAALRRIGPPRRFWLLLALMGFGLVATLMILLFSFVANREATEEESRLDHEHHYTLQLQVKLTALQSRQLAYTAEFLTTHAAIVQATEANSEFVSARNLVAQALEQVPEDLLAPGSGSAERIGKLRSEFKRFMALDRTIGEALKRRARGQPQDIESLLEQSQVLSAGMMMLAEQIEMDTERLLMQAKQRLQAARDRFRSSVLVLLLGMFVVLLYGSWLLVKYIAANNALLVELEQQSFEDPLTGAANRRGWNPALTREIRRVRRLNQPLAVAVIDLDRFKQYNDKHGHAKGDELLQRFVECCANEVRTDDLIARLGGEEFGVMMANADAQLLGERLQRVQVAYRRFGTFSAGVSRLREGDSPATLMERADRAMYLAKDSGRDRVCIDGDAPPAPDTATHAGQHI